jgi:hypothetical protein
MIVGPSIPSLLSHFPFGRWRQLSLFSRSASGMELLLFDPEKQTRTGS